LNVSSGVNRLPNDPNDASCALPRIDEYVAFMRRLEAADAKQEDAIFGSHKAMRVEELREDELDEYLPFCERALVGARSDSTEDGLDRHFPLKGGQQAGRDESATETDRKGLRATVMREEEKRLLPGEGYRIYNSRDMLGSVPEDYAVIIRRGARWVGVEDEYLAGVLEKYERRVGRWWEVQKRRSRMRGGELEDGEEEEESLEEDGLWAI